MNYVIVDAIVQYGVFLTLLLYWVRFTKNSDYEPFGRTRSFTHHNLSPQAHRENKIPKAHH